MSNDKEILDRLREILNEKIENEQVIDYAYMKKRINEILQQKILMGGRLKKHPNPSKTRGDSVAGINYFDFVKQWMSVNPKYTWKEAIELAKDDYHKIKVKKGGVIVGGKKSKHKKLK